MKRGVFEDPVRNEIDGLIETLHRTEQRLAHLTSGEIDTVSDSAGRTFVLHRAQEKLRAGEAAKQAAILDALPATIALLDNAGCIVSVNARWSRDADDSRCIGAKCGVGANYLEACDIAARDGSAEAAQVAVGIRSVLDEGCATFSMEYACHPSTDAQWFLLTVSPLAPGASGGAIVMHVDVSVRAQAKIETRRAATLLQGVLDGAPDAIYAKDREGRYLFCNAVVARHFGCRIDEIVGADDLAFFTAEDAREIARTDRIVLDTACAHVSEKPLTLAQGRREMQTSKVPLRDEHGEVIGLIGISRDVTEQHRLATDLAAEHARLVAVQEIAKIGSWSLDFRTGVFQWSDQMHRIFDTDPLHFVPTMETVGALVHPDDRAAARAANIVSMKTPGGSCTMEHRTLLRSGEERIIEQRWEMFRDDAGRAVTSRGTCQDITERRRAESEVRASQSLLSMSGRLAQVGAWSVDLPPTRVLWSDTVALIHDETAGITPTIDEAFAYYLPEHVDLVREAFTRCAEGGEPFDIEYDIVTARGRRATVRAIGEAVLDDNGAVRRVQGALQDVSERRQAERREQRLADQLASTLETMSDGFFTLDKSWHFTYLNNEAEKLLRRDREDLIGRSIWDVYPDTIGTVFGEHFRGAMAGSQGLSSEALYAPWNVWIGVNCYPSDDGLSIYFHDVTHKRATQQRLELLEAGVSQLKDIVVITKIAPDDRTVREIVFANDAFVRITGYKREEVLGRQMDFLRGAQTDPDELARLIAALDSFEPAHAEIINYRKDGTPYWVEIDVTPVGFKGEGHSHYVMIERDVSERRRNREALEELNADLEARVVLRTAEANLARVHAEDANRAKSSFLATMSHEIRTPMNGVIGMIDVLEQSKLRSGQAEIVKVVRESANALLTIVDDVLDFSKIEAGQFQIDREPMDVETVVEGVCDALNHAAAANGVALLLYTDPAMPRSVFGDATRLRQVLLNLVGNAVKFSRSPHGGGRVRVRARLREREGDQVVLECRVADNGIGMDEAMQARLFTPFTQAEGGATRRFGGTGLGLSISQRLAEMMGGVISVLSEPGRGSTFVLRLTLTASDNEAVESPQLADLRCLVVGGSDTAADDLTAYLSAAGTAVRQVDDRSDILPWIEERMEGACVVIIARAGESTAATLSRCRRTAAEWPSLRLRFVVIEHDGHCDPALAGSDVRCLAGEVLHRKAFLSAVGRVGGHEAPAEANPTWMTDSMTMGHPQDDGGVKGTILVAEDNEINQKVIRRQLALLGFAADIASTGREALDYLQRVSYDILVTDLHMPEMDGYELVRRVREAEAGGRRIPIVALTANAVRGEAKRCRDAGMDDYMTKPVQLANLRTVLGKWIPAVVADESALHAEALSTQLHVVPEASDLPANLDVLAALVGNDHTVIDDMLQSFRRSAGRSSSEIMRALSGDDAGAAGNAAHMLKSGARSIGAVRLGDVCDAIEVAAERGKTAELHRLQSRFEREMEALDRFLDDVQANGIGDRLTRGAPAGFP